MDTKTTLERACIRLEAKYRVPGDFRTRIREILEPLFKHNLDAEETEIIERALERTYVRHASQEAEGVTEAASEAAGAAAAGSDTPSGVAELVLQEGTESVLAIPSVTRDAAELPASPARPRAVATGVPSSEPGKGGLLLVKIDPKTKTAQLIRLSPDDVRAITSKAAVTDFLKEPDDDSTVH
jgi:hypothetical protein